MFHQCRGVPVLSTSCAGRIWGANYKIQNKFPPQIRLCRQSLYFAFFTSPTLKCRGVQVLDTKRGPKSPKFPPKIGFLRGIFDIQLSNTSHTPKFFPLKSGFSCSSYAEGVWVRQTNIIRYSTDTDPNNFYRGVPTPKTNWSKKFTTLKARF